MDRVFETGMFHAATDPFARFSDTNKSNSARRDGLCAAAQIRSQAVSYGSPVRVVLETTARRPHSDRRAYLHAGLRDVVGRIVGNHGAARLIRSLLEGRRIVLADQRDVCHVLAV